MTPAQRREAPVKIIFLDFDGVLVTPLSLRAGSGRHAKGDPGAVAALNAITDETGAKIVVTSTWRRYEMVADLRELLRAWGVTGQVIGATPYLLSRSGDGTHTAEAPRGTEIKAWLDSHGDRYDVDIFVILDDDTDMAPYGSLLIKTDPMTGLTMDDAARAVALLEATR